MGDRQLISRLCSRSLDRAGGQFQHRMSQQAHRQSPGHHHSAKFANLFLSIEVQHVDGKPHTAGMNGLAREDPQPVTLRQAVTPEQSPASFGAGIGNIQRVRDNAVPRFVSNQHSSTEVFQPQGPLARQQRQSPWEQPVVPNHRNWTSMLLPGVSLQGS